MRAGGRILGGETELMVAHNWPWLLDVTHQQKGQDTDLQGTEVTSDLLD